MITQDIVFLLVILWYFRYVSVGYTLITCLMVFILERLAQS